MKRKAIIFLTISVLIISGIFLFSKYNMENQTASAHFGKANPIVYENKKLNISIDPRIELLISVQLTADYERLTNYDSAYKNNMKEYFSKFKNTKAVSLFKGMIPTGYCYDAPPASMLYYSNPPGMKKVIPLPDDLLSRCGGEYALNSFVSELNNYAKETNFNKFYNNNTDLYNAIINQVKNDTKDFDFVSNLEDYYGITQNSYNIILSPMLHPGGYGPSVKNSNGKNDIYGIIGPQSVNNGVPIFDKDSIRYIVWHEFSHSFVNPLTTKNLEDVSQYSKLYTPIAAKMTKMAYPQWEICVNEHIVRAVTIRLTSIYDSPDSAKRLIRQEKSNGFVYIDKLCEKLEVYEKSRDKYKTFEDFYPELINVFKEYYSMNLGEDFYKSSYQGPINNLTNSTDPIIIIVPTNENDAVAQTSIHSVAENIKKTFFKTANIVTDRDALKLDLSNNFIITYGTFDGNLWLSKYKNNFPFKIEKDKIAAGKEYSGTNLRLITIYPNPVSIKNSLLIYTAQRAEDIVKINSVYHGPTDYVIASGEKIIVQDYYKIENGKWSF